MKKQRKLLPMLLLAMSAMFLTACAANETDGAVGDSKGGLFSWGKGNGDYSSGENIPPEEPSEGNLINAAESGFTWGAANGLSGSVQMEYDKDGNRTKAVLVNDANGNVYRTLEYIYDNGKLQSVNTYDANGIQLYRYSYVYYPDADGQLPDTPSEEYGYDLIAEEQSSYHRYNNAYQVEQGKLNGRYCHADYWWMREHDEKGNILTTRLYFKDYFGECVFTFNYEGSTLTGVTYHNDGLHMGTYNPEYDAEGRIVKLKYGDESQGSTEKSFNYDYDSGGRLVKLSHDYGSGNDEYLEFQYGENGLLTYCHLASENHDASFYYDEKGNLAGREGFVYSLGGGDIGAKAYEYYDNGIIKAVKEYHSFTIEEDKAEKVTEYYENGPLSSVWVYRPSNHEGYHNFYTEEGGLLRSVNLRGEDRTNLWTSKETNYDGQGNKLNETSYREDGSISVHEEWSDLGPAGWITSLRQSFRADGTISMDGKLEGNIYTDVWYNEDGSIDQIRVREYLDDKYIFTQKNAAGEVYSTEEINYK